MFFLSTKKRLLTAVLLVPGILFQGMIVPTPAQTSTDQVAVAQTPAPFPRSYQLTTGEKITLYAPQIEDWADQSKMTAYSAVAVEQKSGTEPVLGSIKIVADTQVSVDERLVRFRSFEIPEVNFPKLSKEDVQKVTAGLKSELPESDRVFSLDWVLGAVEKSQLNVKPVEASGVKADPPAIFYSSTPSVLVGVDGDPVWSPVKDVDLKFAVNTNWDLFQAPTTNVYYLRVNESWLSSTDLKSGWAPVDKLPESFRKLPADDNWKEVKANVPGKKISAKNAPKVMFATGPAELILTEGAPKYEPVKGTSLLWVSNTESDLFRNGSSGDFYYLVAGRWFSAAGMEGPWTFATPDLPEDFQKIPVEHPRSRVLASVPGTRQATEAILQASIPRTARVNKTQIKAPEVVYQGDPVYKAIEGTELARAVNTDKDIIKFGDSYYLCYQAVWFVSKSATGPWAVATDIPKEIYTIPASSPSYNVTYVTVKQESSSSDWVTFSYYAGYTGMMVAYGCVVWGTGWYYPPYVYYGGYYPIYYPYYRTYGVAAWYNPYTGTYGRGAVVYGPYGGAGFGAAYNPYTGTYARGAAAYGPYGSRSFAQAYNPRTGTYAQTRQGSNIYGSWGSSYVQRGDDWIQTGRVTDRQTGTTTGGLRTSEGGGIVTRAGDNGRTTVGRTGSGDVYAGKDGSVYRRTDSGWQKYENGNWNPAGGGNAQNRTTNRTNTIDRSTYDQLNRDFSRRTESTQRTRDYTTYRSNMGGRSSAGSFRGGGGVRRGGGRIR